MKKERLLASDYNNVLITYIIPCYNAEQNILKLLESISISSSQIKYEIICIDDGSTDDTYNIINGFCSAHNNVYLIHQNNSGVSAARNNGIKKARGKYIVFADSDDEYLFPCSNLIDENCDVQLVVFGFEERSLCGYKRIGCLTDALCSTQEYINNAANIKSMLYFNSCWNKVYRADIIRDIDGFDETVSLGEDALFNYKYLSRCSKIKISRECCYLYNNVSSSSLSRRTISIDTLWKCYSSIANGFTDLCRGFGCEIKADEVFSGYYFGTLNAFVNAKKVNNNEVKTIKAMVCNTEFTNRIVAENRNRFNYLIRLLTKNKLYFFAYIFILLVRLSKLIAGKKG